MPSRSRRSRDAEGKLAFVFHAAYPWCIGGLERFYWALCRDWPEGEAPDFVTRRYWKGSRRHREDGVSFIGLGASRGAGETGIDERGKLAFATQVMLYFLRHGGDYRVVHCSAFPSLTLIGCWIGLLPHRRTKLVAHWIEVLPVSSHVRRRGVLGLALGVLQRLALGLGDAAVTKSLLHEGRLRPYFRGRPICILAGFTPESVAREVPSSGEPRKPTIVFLGRLASEKRPHLVPLVLRELRAKDPAWCAVMFGDGPEREQVEAAAAEAGVSEHLDLFGFRPWSEVSAGLFSASVLVHPTEREGFGLVVIEAASHGLPTLLVAEPDNAAVELIEDRRNGIVCDDAEPASLAAAVLELAGDPAIHEKTREWYEEAEERFTPAVAVRQLSDLHARLITDDE